MKDINYGRDKVTGNSSFIFPKGEKLTSNELLGFIAYNETVLKPRYKENMKLYLGKHNILTAPGKETGADNRIVVNSAKYVVDVYNGYFCGIEPKLSLLNGSSKIDEIARWNRQENFFDTINEISKQCDIFGRSIASVYQGEDARPHLMYSSPNHAFIIYDDTVQRQPLAFVHYQIDNSNNWTDAYGVIQYTDKLYRFKGYDIEEDTNEAGYAINPYGLVPAVEFFENEERQGIFDSIKTLINALDKVISQKANQVEYFDNAYMYMLGFELPEDDEGNPKFDFKNNRVLYVNHIDPDTNPQIGFISKPDADQMQENLIQHLTDFIFMMAMVPNIQDKNFAGNSSGVALQYKLFAMKNKADSKERKFDKSLMQLYRIVLATLFNNKQDQELWSELDFKFTRNLPEDMASAIDSAKNAEGIVSKKTQLGMIPDIDPESEMKQISKEKTDAIQQVQKLSLPIDGLKRDDDVKKEQ